MLKQDDELSRLRHSAAHLMAQAVKHLFPDAKVTIGPPTAEGFYYDFDKSTPFTPDDLEAIEAEMRKNASADFPFERRAITKPEAIALFTKLDEPYKLEMIGETPDDEPMSVYQHGDFIDWCRGPHIASTGQIQAFKLLSVAGAYWRGDEKRQQLQRIYGTAFFNQGELDAHLQRLEEAKKRDHRKLGRELGLFLIAPEVGAGLPLWLPKGTIIRETLVEFMRAEQLKRGYQPVVTPHVAKTELYKISGHYQKFGEGWPVMRGEHEEFMLKPVNCPHHILIYKSELRSYRDLPIRYAEFGTTYRYEQSGELGGLTRVRGFTVDDSHLFVRPDQLIAEFKAVVELIQLVFARLRLTDWRARVGLRDPASDKYIGDDEIWEKAQAALMQAVDELGLPHEVAEGEAAMYGPKLDFLVRDAIGREWQLGTVQVDYALPERFGLEYMAEDGKAHRPVMIHRAPFGSLERFIGVLIEHFAGAFPLWLAPVQMVLLPIADRHHDYARGVAERLNTAGFRIHIDDRNEKVGYKIREAQLQKIPYMLVMGDKEAEAGSVSVRSRDQGDQGPRPVEEFVAQAREELTAA